MENLKIKKLQNFNPVFQFTKDQLSDVKEAFEIFDHEGIGLIPVKYLGIILRATGLSSETNEVYELGECVGKSYEDNLTLEEFVAILRKLMSTEPQLNFLMKAFRLYDNENKGSITSTDLERVSHLLGDYLLEEDIQDMIVCATGNKSNTEVTFDHFVSMLRKPFDPDFFLSF